MPLFLNKCPIAICDRCQQKAGWDELVPDGNSPGLRVHRSKDCYDILNPWRLPNIRPDRIALKWSRPDTPLDAGVPYPDYTNPINPVPPNEGDYPTTE